MQWKDSRVLVRRFRSYETQQGKSFTIKWTLTKEFINVLLSYGFWNIIVSVQFIRS